MVNIKNGVIENVTDDVVINMGGTFNIPSGITRIGNGAFERCGSLEEIIIPEGVTEIGSFAFGYCFKLKKVTFPESLKSIGSFAFEFCDIKEINVPNTLTKLGEGVFNRRVKYVNGYSTKKIEKAMNRTREYVVEWSDVIREIVTNRSEEMGK